MKSNFSNAWDQFFRNSLEFRIEVRNCDGSVASFAARFLSLAEARRACAGWASSALASSASLFDATGNLIFSA